MKNNVNLALWLSTPNTALIEMAKLHGFSNLVLDIEHGLFDLKELDQTITFAKSQNFTVHSKVLGPEAIPIQQALDMGSDTVIIPHIEGLEHAHTVCSFAKYPDMGKRSYAGGRTVAYSTPSTDFFASENDRVRCYPMIETAEALNDIESILSLACVDGVFVGPSDLSLSRGRGAYRNTAEDKADLTRIATAANATDKAWLMPAWTADERTLSKELGVDMMVVGEEQGLLYDGLSHLMKTVNQE